MSLNQRTIGREVEFRGIGLHTGNLTSMRFIPAPPDASAREAPLQAGRPTVPLPATDA